MPAREIPQHHAVPDQGQPVHGREDQEQPALDKARVARIAIGAEAADEPLAHQAPHGHDREEPAQFLPPLADDPDHGDSPFRIGIQSVSSLGEKSHRGSSRPRGSCWGTRRGFTWRGPRARVRRGPSASRKSHL